MKVTKPQRRRGAAVVEFAVVAPVLIILVFGMIEFGRAIMVQQVIVNATREGARAAVVEGAALADVNTAIDTQLNASSITSPTVAFSVDGATVGDPTVGSSGDAIGVTVTVNYSDVTWLPVPSFLGGTQLTATSVMRREATN